MFFPNRDNETKLASVLRKAKKSLDVCVFALTNDRLRDAILYAYERQEEFIINYFLEEHK